MNTFFGQKLDKIVQIPFTIPATDEAGFKNYLHTLLPRPGEQPRNIPEQVNNPPTQTAQTGMPVTSQVQTPSSTENKVDIGSTSTVPAIQPSSESQIQPTSPVRPVIEVSFTENERQSLDDFVKFISHNPRRAKRIVNIYRLTRMLADRNRTGLPSELSRRLIKWVILTEQWPYRMGLIIAQRENADQTGEDKGSKDTDTLADLYFAVADKLTSEEGKRLLHLDDDPELFVNFITRDATLINAADIRSFEHLTFNLNPAIGGEVRSMLARAYTTHITSNTGNKSTKSPSEM